MPGPHTKFLTVPRLNYRFLSLAELNTAIKALVVELNQLGLLRMDFQSELLQPLLKLLQEAHGFSPAFNLRKAVELQMATYPQRLKEVTG